MLKIPKGWRRVTRGVVKLGDLLKWTEHVERAQDSIGRPVIKMPPGVYRRMKSERKGIKI